MFTVRLFDPPQQLFLSALLISETRKGIVSTKMPAATTKVSVKGYGKDKCQRGRSLYVNGYG